MYVYDINFFAMHALINILIPGIKIYALLVLYFIVLVLYYYCSAIGPVSQLKFDICTLELLIYILRS